MQLSTVIMQDEVKSDEFWTLVPMFAKGLELLSAKLMCSPRACSSVVDIFATSKPKICCEKGEVKIFMSVLRSPTSLLQCFAIYTLNIIILDSQYNVEGYVKRKKMKTNFLSWRIIVFSFKISL